MRIMWVIDEKIIILMENRFLNSNSQFQSKTIDIGVSDVEIVRDIIILLLNIVRVLKFKFRVNYAFSTFMGQLKMLYASKKRFKDFLDIKMRVYVPFDLSEHQHFP